MARPRKKTDVYDVVSRTGKFFITRNEAEIAGPYHQKFMAEDGIDSLERASRMSVRKCMTCQQDFSSEGIHNRMCGPCRNKTEGMV